jgi:hypothetical protein
MRNIHFRTPGLLLALLVAVLVAQGAAAQIQTGSILVRLTDAQGAILPGATVTISSPVLVGGTMTGMTDAGGAYRFPSLPPGTYQVKVDLPGFKSMVRESVAVNVGSTTSVDQQMLMAGLQETVKVTAEAPVIDRSSATVSTTLNEQLLQATPGGRDIWSQMEYKVPGLTIDRPDVGGNQGGLQGGLSARGTDNSQNTHFLNGVNVGDPAAIGYTQFYYDYDAFQEIQASVGAHDLSVQSGGLFLNMVTKSGTNRWLGRTSYYYQGDSTQSSNVGSDLVDLGLSPSAGSVKFVSDGTFQIGGPLVHDKLHVFGSARDWRVHVNVPGFSEVEQTNMTSGLGNLSYQLTRNNRITGFIARQLYDKPNRGASAFNTPASNWKERDIMSIYQGLWNSVLGNRSFFDARVSYADIFFPLYLKSSAVSVLDLQSFIITGANSNEWQFTRRRLQANANLSYYLEEFAGARHELRVGVDYSHAPTKSYQFRNGDVDLFTDGGQPAFVSEYNSPVLSQQAVNGIGLYAQDGITYRRLTINGGVRYQHTEGYLPAQSSPAGTFVGARSFDERRNVISWNTVSPRVGAIFDLTGDSRTVAKASAARYYYVVSTGDPDIVNQNAASFRQFVWNDLNGDSQFQAGEEGALVAVGGSNISTIDPSLKQPHTDELILGIDREVIRGMRLGFTATWRREGNIYGPINTGVPFSAYTPLSIVDPGPDGAPGTADDGSLTVFNQDPATIGQDALFYTNRPEFDRRYHGVEITAEKRYSDRWQLLVGYTYGKSTQTNVNSSLANPNLTVNASGATYFDRPHTFKVTGSYLLPLDVQVSGNVLVQSGTAWSYNNFVPFRIVTTTLNQGSVNVFANAPGIDRTPTLKTLDLRGAKIVKFGDRALEVAVDVYNVFNSNTAFDINPYTGQTTTASGRTVASFGVPTGILGPRIVRFGAKFTF